VSAQNGELVRRIHAADGRGDYELALSFFAPDVVLDATHMPDGQVFCGLDEVRGHVADWRSGWRDFQEEVEDVLEAGDRVVIFYRDRGIGRSSGVETEIRYASVWDLHDGKITRMKNFLDRDEALRHAGLGWPAAS
jgi:ketosteroid isomerase-like protein